MKTRTWAFSMVATLVLAAPAAFSADDGAGPPSGYVTRELASEFPYVPSPLKIVPAASSSQTLSAEVAPESAGEYRSKARIRRLSEAIQRQVADARSAEIADRLGIGVRAFPVGRHFAAGVATVFYIPIWIAAGFSW